MQERWPGWMPFIRGAAGNVPTEDAVNMFASMGIDTGIELNTLIEAVAYLETTLNRSLPGRVNRGYIFRNLVMIDQITYTEPIYERAQQYAYTIK
jgi:hypothetical protein